MTKVFGILSAGAAACGAFVGGFFFQDVASGKDPDGEALAALVNPDLRKERSPVAVFKQHFGQIQTRYFKPVEKNELKYAAMQGAFSSLGDPHTSFLEPRLAESFSLETQGGFVGIGARLDDDPLGAKITSVFDGSPAARAGLAAQDVIVRVNGKDMAGIPTEEIVNHIRGEEGTTVNIVVLRKGDRKEFNVRRSRVLIPTAEGKMVPGTSIGRISVTQFAEITPAQFKAALDDLSQAGMKGLIVDMRGNPGGLLEAATAMLSLFVENKTVVTMKGRNSEEKREVTPRGELMELPVPVAVLVNEDSASAAEIFAGVLRDYGKAVLVGQHTYGKASVQNVIPIRDGASAKITTSRYYLPSGKDISRRVDEDGAYVSGGLKPDVEVEFKIEDGVEFGEPGKDSQLDKAIEVLKERLKL